MPTNETNSYIASRFDACSHPSKNFNLALLYEASIRFGFSVDARGPFPIMVRGMNAATYTSHRDMLNFISRPSFI